MCDSGCRIRASICASSPLQCSTADQLCARQPPQPRKASADGQAAVQVETYADPGSREGSLEPECTVQIKPRQ